MSGEIPVILIMAAFVAIWYIAGFFPTRPY